MSDANITPTPAQLENRRKWVALLRSDKYEQTLGKLAGGDDALKRCCLGVACDPTIVPDVEQRPISLFGGIDRWALDGDDALLPPSAQAALGLPHSPTVQTVTDSAAHLSALNDGGNYTYAMIADLIERNFVAPYEQPA